MLIGSRAIAYWNKDFKVKPGSDWDIVGDSRDDAFYRRYFNIPVGDRIEWHSPQHLNNSKIQEYYNCDPEDLVCNPYGLAVLYRSHLHREHKWDAHITKYHRHILPLLSIGDILLEHPALIERIKLTKVAYPQGNPNLNQSNEDFFDDSVKKVYDHDYLHELYSYDGRPMYEKLKHPGNMDSAWCEKDLWNGLTKEQQLQCVAEETYVIATERFMVPNDWNFSTKRAYYMALRKVCTTLCSGWFRDFAIDNFPKVYELYDDFKFKQVKVILLSK